MIDMDLNKSISSPLSLDLDSLNRARGLGLA